MSPTNSATPRVWQSSNIQRRWSFFNNGGWQSFCGKIVCDVLPFANQDSVTFGLSIEDEMQNFISIHFDPYNPSCFQKLSWSSEIFNAFRSVQSSSITATSHCIRARCGARKAKWVFSLKYPSKSLSSVSRTLCSSHQMVRCLKTHS